MKHIRDQDNITDFGLRFLLDVRKDLVLSQEVIDTIM